MKRSASGDSRAFRVVTRLFLRRLIDNDLISPHADRHHSLAVLYALVVSLAVFATFFLSTGYLAAFIQLPGPAALSALADRFLYIAASMTVSALAALMVWDALALEPRDAAILGPLPIAARTLTRAKLAAAVVFGTVLTVALNAVPSVLYPLFLTLNIRGTHGATILRLIAAHAATVTMAGLFGFFGVLAVRGTLRWLAGERAFGRLASVVQSALVVAVITGLLLAPTVRASDVRRWVDGTRPPGSVVPVLWYLAINEVLAGHLVADTRVVLPPRLAFFPFPRRVDEDARTIYHGLMPRFAALANQGWLSLPVVAGLAIATFFWTNRRFPDRAATALRPTRFYGAVRRAAERLTRGDPEAQAGFFFTLQTLTRSAPHRTIVAVSLAVGLTHAFIALTQTGIHRFELSSMPRAIPAMSVFLLISLLAGFWYAATVPAEPLANWTIRSAWLGNQQSYLSGVKRAGGIALAAVPLLLMLPLNASLMGTAAAVEHSVIALLFATALLDALFVFVDRFPFACSYVPVQNPKVAWPASLAGVLTLTYGFAALECQALVALPRTVALCAALSVLAVLVKTIDREWRCEERPIEFDARPTPATQRLDLAAH
ncbi:MAG TPA: hypothetical protein VH497_11640 [Vicinamibacterales bacterium]